MKPNFQEDNKIKTDRWGGLLLMCFFNLTVMLTTRNHLKCALLISSIQYLNTLYVMLCKFELVNNVLHPKTTCIIY